jgi:CrcB protein
MTRHVVSVQLAERAGGLPWATLSVNLIGSLLIGVLGALAFHGQLPLVWRAALVTGFLGGLTTFSSYSFETFELMRTGRVGLAAAYAGGSVLLGVLAAAGGFRAAESLLSSP